MPHEATNGDPDTQFEITKKALAVGVYKTQFTGVSTSSKTLFIKCSPTNYGVL